MSDCLELLKHLGVPAVQVQPATAEYEQKYSPGPLKLSLVLVSQAPGDAEALCARLVGDGSVDAVASEDMDTLPFGANTLIRQLNAKRDG